MTDKAPPAGWVVQVTTPGQPSLTPSPGGRLSSALGAPSFKYFNVAIADVDKALVATTKHPGATGQTDVAAVRSLSSGEIAALNVKTGEVKPA